MTPNRSHVAGNARQPQMIPFQPHLTCQHGNARQPRMGRWALPCSETGTVP